MPSLVAIAAMTNAYAARLGIEPPRLENLRARLRERTLLDWTACALLERGGPMSVEEVASRLLELGLVAANGDLALSIKRAWHGLPPVVRALQGGLDLAVDSHELDFLIRELRLRPEGPASSKVPPPPPELPGPEAPLTRAEVELAFSAGTNYSPLRQATAVLDALGPSLPFEQVESFLASLTPHRVRLSLETARHWRGEVELGAGGELTLRREATGLAATRAAVRTKARMALDTRERRERERERMQAAEAKHAEEARRQQAQFAGLRRAFLHALTTAGRPVLWGLMDLGTQALTAYGPEQAERLVEQLSGFDAVVGLEVRERLGRLGLAPARWRLVDLKLPQRTRTVARPGRRIKLTTEMLITATTGIARPLVESAKVAGLSAAAERGELERALQADVRALLAYYRYGALHGFVRMRWGLLDESLPVEWAMPGEQSAWQLLREARESGATVEVVVGAPPEATAPWDRAIRGRCLAQDAYTVTLEVEGVPRPVFREKIHAIRIAGESGR